MEEAQRPGAGVSDRKQDAELRRYREAGASDAVRYRAREAVEEIEKVERMLEDLKRIRRDEEVFDDVLGQGGKRTPITAVVADLSDPKDPGTRKAVARIKRSMRGG